MNSKIKNFPKKMKDFKEVEGAENLKDVEEAKNLKVDTKETVSNIRKLEPEEIKKFKDHTAITKELYAEMGRLESAKLDIYGQIQQLSRNYNTMVDEMFARLKCDPNKRYDLNIETGIITEL